MLIVVYLNPYCMRRIIIEIQRIKLIYNNKPKLFFFFSLKKKAENELKKIYIEMGSLGIIPKIYKWQLVDEVFK